MWMNFRDEDFVRNKTVYIALGILPDGTKKILGIRFEHTEGVRHNAEMFSFNVIVMDA
jgi:putative transposase